MSFLTHQNNSLLWLSSSLLDGQPVRHGFSTRLGGVSPAPWDSLNLDDRRGDDLANVQENFRRLCAALDVDVQRIVLSRQVHRDDVRTVTADDCGNSYSWLNPNSRTIRIGSVNTVPETQYTRSGSNRFGEVHDVGDTLQEMTCEMQPAFSFTIDALDQSISLMYSTKSYELVDQVTLLAQQPLADALFCSTKWWNSIPAEYQEIIEEELHEAGLRYNQYSVENESKMREEMEAAGVQFHEADRQAFLDMGCSDLVLKYGIGQELLDTLAEIRAAE